MPILAASDLHADFKQNFVKLANVSATEHQADTLIIAGDIAHRVEIIEATLRLLQSKFRHLFYVPGNHELWVQESRFRSSIHKFHCLLDLCDSLGVHTAPTCIDDSVWVVPLFSWYHPDFDLDGSGDLESLKGWADFHWCKWPRELKEASAYFLRRNDRHIKPYDAPVISFSHFLPRRDLLPDTKNLRFKGLPKVAGTTGLDDQIRALKATIHVFGHSHINADVVIDGVRYVQNALSYPRDAEKNANFAFKRIW